MTTEKGNWIFKIVEKDGVSKYVITHKLGSVDSTFNDNYLSYMYRNTTKPLIKLSRTNLCNPSDTPDILIVTFDDLPTEINRFGLFDLNAVVITLERVNSGVVGGCGIESYKSEILVKSVTEINFLRLWVII